MRRTGPLAAALILAAALPARAEERTVPTSTRTGLELTVYANGTALVRDRRTLSLDKGATELALEGVSRNARPETALLRPLCQTPFRVREQAFDFDVMSADKLLKASVGRPVELILPGPDGTEQVVPAQLLSVDQGTVVEAEGRIRVGVRPEQLLFSSLPEGLRPAPALTAVVESPSGGACPSELAYLTGGVSWRADYTLDLSRDQDRFDISAWATLTNTSGIDYPGARLQLVAGEVRVEQPVMQAKAAGRMLMAEASVAAPVADVAREQLGSFHLYDLAEASDLPDQQTKQLALLSAQGVEAEVKYRSRGPSHAYRSRIGDPQETNAESLLTFTNDRQSGLGKPLPAGSVRIYTRDSHGTVQFIGEDRLDNVAEGRPVTLTLGNDFDVTVKRVQTDYRRPSDEVVETTHKLTLRNGKDKPVTLEIEETLPGDWRITSESAEHEKLASNRVRWTAALPAKGSAELTYAVTVRYR